MAMKTKIEWTEATWNPMTGCSKVSPGCLNCYAEKMANRLRAMGNRKYQNGFNFTVHSNVFSYPLRWRKPHSIFVNSMSDTFHESCTDVDILSLFQIMEEDSEQDLLDLVLE